jgi:hypothetical protein
MRVVVPYLRGHVPTQFLSGDTVRSGQQDGLGADGVALPHALGHPAGGAGRLRLGWPGGLRVRRPLARAVHRDRAVNGYLVQDIAASTTPLRPELEAGF